MIIVRGANLALSFVLELGMLAAFAYWGAITGSRLWISIVLAVVVPVATIAFWGVVMAPKARAKPGEPWHTILALVLFGLAASALYSTGLTAVALVFVGLAVANRAARILLRQY